MDSHSARPPYHVTVQPVEEVSLLGIVGPSCLEDIFSSYRLSPIRFGEGVGLMVSATSARFMGKPFRELSFSVLVSDDEGIATGDGAFMLHAFNSSRLFAWVERTFFHTPYYFGDLAVTACGTPSMRLQRNGRMLLDARLSLSNRTPIRSQEEGWEGPIHLWKRAGGDPRRLFYARLWGHTRVYAFDSETDVFDLSGGADERPFRWLREGGFQPREWHIRESAVHSKSKTVLRDGGE